VSSFIVIVIVIVFDSCSTWRDLIWFDLISVHGVRVRVRVCVYVYVVSWHVVMWRGKNQSEEREENVLPFFFLLLLSFFFFFFRDASLCLSLFLSSRVIIDRVLNLSLSLSNSPSLSPSKYYSTDLQFDSIRFDSSLSEWVSESENNDNDCDAWRSEDSCLFWYCHDRYDGTVQVTPCLDRFRDFFFWDFG